MERAITKMPVKCSRCGAFFDLSYDLDGEDEQLVWAFASRLRALGKRGMLCWNCRN